MIRVLILAGSAAQARAIAELLSEDDRIEILASASSATFIDVIIAVGVSRNELPPEGNFVFLTDDDPVVFEDRGRAWLPPQVTAAELAAAVFAAAQDLTVLTQDQAQRRLPSGQISRDHRNDFAEPLTGRELQVLNMLVSGSGNKEIANQLGISEHTAKFHVAQILAKLGVSSRTEAVMAAIRRGLVSI